MDAVVDPPGVEQVVDEQSMVGERGRGHAGYTTALAVNSPEAEQFETLYGRLWRALRRHDDTDLSQHELQLLHHVPAPGGGSITLYHLAHHLALPKSTASVLVKDLERRGFLRRDRDPRNERQLAIVLTDVGAQRVAADTVLDLGSLTRAMATLRGEERQAMLVALQRLANASEAQSTE
jgi:DNA-binding MarR family transcriptional regulator